MADDKKKGKASEPAPRVEQSMCYAALLAGHAQSGRACNVETFRALWQAAGQAVEATRPPPKEGPRPQVVVTDGRR